MTKRTTITRTEPLAMVVRDSRNACRDYPLPLKRAVELYRAGKLAWDVTGGQYCTHTVYDRPE